MASKFTLYLSKLLFLMTKTNDLYFVLYLPNFSSNELVHRDSQ
jgi:hypothetical protein